jgi:hypothetical protein
MKEKIHEHLMNELQVNTKTDRIFILTSIVLNFAGLGGNSMIAMEGDEGGIGFTFMFLIILALIIIINAVAIFGLSKGKQMRNRLLTGLLTMYKDEKVDKYYDERNLGAYNKRYNLFTIGVLTTGAVAISVPLVLLIMG